MVTFLKTVPVAFELHALSSVRGKQATVKQLCFLFGCQYQLTSNSTQGGVGDNVRLTGSRQLKKRKKYVAFCTWKGASSSPIISNAIKSFFVTPTFPSMRRQMLLNLINKYSA